MERIGDQAADIAEITVSMAEVGGTIDLAPIQEMSAITMQMVEKSIGAFVNKDDELATKVIYMDDQVDDCFDSIKMQIINLINKNTEVGEKATDILMIAKYLERIGDHATNIADWVVYSIRGKHEKGNDRDNDTDPLVEVEPFSENEQCSQQCENGLGSFDRTGNRYGQMFHGKIGKRP